jgi:hypothetical protein
VIMIMILGSACRSITAAMVIALIQSFLEPGRGSDGVGQGHIPSRGAVDSDQRCCHEDSSNHGHKRPIGHRVAIRAAYQESQK